MTRRSLPCSLVVAALLLAARPAAAHPAPFSYLDLRLGEGGVRGTLVIHDFDAAHELSLEAPDTLLDPAIAARHRDALVRRLSPRISLFFDGRAAPIVWGALDTVPERRSLRLSFTIGGETPTLVHLRALLFPYDSAHQTFVNMYEEGALKHQAILDAHRLNLTYHSGAAQGWPALIKTFALSGIEHILIGPDHVLFLIGLLLLRGSPLRLVAIITAFTIGHSLTLSLAVLEIVSPPSRFIEPLIALTLVIVGADNLLVLSASNGGKPSGTDVRPWLAACFGLIHGFGFASVLKEFGLPQGALGWSLFAFNLGVEIGQLFIVGVVAGLLALLARRRPQRVAHAAWAGSIAVILAGLCWFVSRTFFPGGS